MSVRDAEAWITRASASRESVSQYLQLYQLNFVFKLSITNESLDISPHNQDALPIGSHHC